MKQKIQIIATVATLVLIAAMGVVAQHSHDHGDQASWKKGMVRLSDAAWVGNVRLRSGMYHAKHIVERDRHMLVFRSVALPGGKQFPMWEGKEVARVECRVEPAEKSVRNTKVIFARTSNGARTIQEIQIAGEKVRHILLNSTPAV